MPLIFQKYLAWVQRYFYQAAAGQLPPAQLTLSIDHDWPLEPLLLIPLDYVSIAGTVSTDLYAPAADRHGLVYCATAQVAAGVAVPNTDDWSVLLRAPTGDATRIFEAFAHAIPLGEMMPIIGALKVVQATPFEETGIVRPVYVGPNQTLRVNHTSVAGGSQIRLRGWVIDRPSYYPLRLP